MSLSNNSYSTVSNIQFGSNELPAVWVNSQTFGMPTITLAPPKVNSRAGAMVNLSSDTVDFSELSVDVILDKDWEVWNELYKYFLDGLNVEQGTFKHNKHFDMFIEFFDGEGNSKKKFLFYKCRLISFGDMSLTTMDTDEVYNTLNITMVFDYFEDQNNTFAKELQK